MSESNTICWCETCRPVTMSDMRMVLCPDCGNKRCPKATFHGNVCTKSNTPGQPGSSYEHVKPESRFDTINERLGISDEAGRSSSVPTIVKVKWDGRRAGYYVDRPNWNGGEMVSLEEIASYIENDSECLMEIKVEETKRDYGVRLLKALAQEIRSLRNRQVE